MKKLARYLHDFFIPAGDKAREESYRKGRIFVNSTLITALFALFFLVNTVVFRMPHHRVSMLACTFGFIALAFLYRWGVGIITCVVLYVSLAALATFWDGYYLDGLHSYDFIWICIAPVMGVLLGNLRTGWFGLGMSVLAIGVMAYLQFSGHVFESDIDPQYHHLHGMNSLIALSAILFVVVMVLEKAFEISLHKLDQKNRIIEEEKKRSDELLLNILPQEVMEELKETGKTTARNYDLVTVLFADFANFTGLIEEMPPELLVSTLDEYFRMMDEVTSHYPVEKIKTVGDAYICAAGLRGEGSSDNPVVMVQAAMEIAEGMERMNVRRLSEGKPIFEMRMGIHSGPLVAGVVGVKKFAYDIWGDTVNTAARMQQSGETGRINLSGTTRELVKHRFICQYRGRLEVKHKGELDMYFVEKRK